MSAAARHYHDGDRNALDSTDNTVATEVIDPSLQCGRGIIPVNNPEDGRRNASPALRVLIVEDDETVRGVLEVALRELSPDLELQSAADADQALWLARDSQPDLAILDVMLPGRDGIELAAALHVMYGPELPILAISALDNLTEAAYHMRAYSQLEKPFELVHFEMAVLRGLRMRSRPGGPYSRPSDVAC